MEKINNELDDFKSSIDDIMKELETNPEMINNFSNEQLVEIEKKLNPYGATIYGPEKYTCISFTNLREKYMTKLLTTALIGFTYQMNKEYIIEEEDLKTNINKKDFIKYVQHPDANNKQLLDNLYNSIYTDLKDKLLKSLELDQGIEILLSEEQEMQLASETTELVNKEVGPKEELDNDAYINKKEELINKQSKEEKEIIERFLNKLFKYDPELHSKPSVNLDHNDSERTEENEFTEIQPPNDTYGRFQYYYDVNYEKLRNAVMYLYGDKPDLEVAINVFDTFDTVEECNTYIEKNKENVICNLLNLTNYKWNLLGSFSKNRERVTFYNKNTSILENILKQQEDDAKMGKALLNDRVRKRKTKNIKEYGKDHPNFLRYKKENPTGILESTDEKIVVEEEIEVSETGSKIDADGTPEDCIEIGVTSINLKTNTINTGKIYTKAKSPDTIDQ